MPDEHTYRKNPSAAELAQRWAADEAARKAAVQVVERWNAERSPADEREAIAKAAKEFRQPAAKLIAVRRRP